MLMGIKKNTEDNIIEFLSLGGNTTAAIHSYIEKNKQISKSL